MEEHIIHIRYKTDKQKGMYVTEEKKSYCLVWFCMAHTLLVLIFLKMGVIFLGVCGQAQEQD